jgi:hypothetical protein
MSEHSEVYADNLPPDEERVLKAVMHTLAPAFLPFAKILDVIANSGHPDRLERAYRLRATVVSACCQGLGGIRALEVTFNDGMAMTVEASQGARG